MASRAQCPAMSGGSPASPATPIRNGASDTSYAVWKPSEAVTRTMARAPGMKASTGTSTRRGCPGRTVVMLSQLVPPSGLYCTRKVSGSPSGSEASQVTVIDPDGKDSPPLGPVTRTTGGLALAVCLSSVRLPRRTTSSLAPSTYGTASQKCREAAPKAADTWSTSKLRCSRVPAAPRSSSTYAPPAPSGASRETGIGLRSRGVSSVAVPSGLIIPATIRASWRDAEDVAAPPAPAPERRARIAL